MRADNVIYKTKVFQQNHFTENENRLTTRPCGMTVFAYGGNPKKITPHFWNMKP